MRLQNTCALWGCDGGTVLCTEHLGAAARHTGRDISGQRIEAIPPEEADRCETCGRNHDEVVKQAPHHPRCAPGCPGFRDIPDSHWDGCDEEKA